MPVLIHRARHRVSHFKYLRRIAKYGVLRSLDESDHAINTGVDFTFVAGCGHTGTTLLTSRLGRHPNVLAIPRETGIFLPHNSMRPVKQLIEAWMDFAAIAEKSMVLEKTPKHIHAIDRIKRILPESRFLLTSRNPLDCIGSLYLRFGDFELSLERWLIDHRAVVEGAKRHNAPIIKFEDLTSHHREALDTAQDHLGLEKRDLEADKTHSVFDQIQQSGFKEVRKNQIIQPIRPNSGHGRSLLSDTQCDQIRKRTHRLCTHLQYEEYLHD